jgi:PPP family 3-phenylpropionic acid transporter
MSPRLRAALIYFCYFAAGGSLSPYLNLYYQNVGMTKQQIGVLIATTTLTTVIASPVWGGLADAFRLHRYLLPLAIFGTLGPVALLIRSTDFTALWLLVMLYAFFNGPIVALADNSVLEMLGNDRSGYGKLRVWGAVGFGASAWGGGVLAEQFGMTTGFTLYLVFMFLCALLSIKMPAPKTNSSDSFLRNLRRLSTNPVWLGFLASIFLVGIGSSFIHNYTALFVDDLGGGEGLYGLSIAIAGVSELPVFFFSARLIKRFSARGVLIIGFLSFFIRLLLISAIPSPEWIIVPSLLHGMSFSALWVAGVVYVSRIAPPGLGATAQAALGVTLFGAAGAVGGILGANVYEFAGPAAVFRVGAISALLGLCCFVLVELYARRQVAEAVNL